MYDLYNMPDDPGPNHPMPLWFKLVVVVPGLATMASLALASVAQGSPALSHAAGTLLVISGLSFMMGAGSLILFCLFNLMRGLFRHLAGTGRQ